MSTLGDAADGNPVIKVLQHTLHICGRNLITGLTSAASTRVDISSTCKVGQKLGVSLPLLTCSLRRDLPGYCIAEFGNPGGTYELLCIILMSFLAHINYCTPNHFDRKTCDQTSIIFSSIHVYNRAKPFYR